MAPRRGPNDELGDESPPGQGQRAALAEFAAIASHDLSVPLQLISGYAQLLEDRIDPGDPEVAEALEGIQSGVGRMRALVDGLLAYRRVGDDTAPVGPVDSGAALRDALEDLAPAIQESGAEVSVRELPVVLGNRGQLQQLFQNLISNAVKFRSAEAPRIEVSARPEPGVWQFTVQDNGRGIEPRDEVLIFEMFRRARTAKGAPGSGIGLAIAKRVVEHHGGQIWAEPAPGSGSRLHFTIPLEMRRESDPAVAPDDGASKDRAS